MAPASRFALKINSSFHCSFASAVVSLADACLDYLNYDRLGEKEVHEHLTNGAHDLRHWLKDHGVESASREL
jgi:hypothetical protein